MADPQPEAKPAQDSSNRALHRIEPHGARQACRLAPLLLRAQEDERRRIAREMNHDWTQRLAVLGIDLAVLEKHVGDPEGARPLLHALQERLIGLSRDMHALSRQLHPSILEDLGLVEALRFECSAFSRREGIRIDYRAVDRPVAVPKEVALCVYRVAQEALRNLARHAAVEEARVILELTGAALMLRVEDRGRGFDPAKARTLPGLGLSGMAERVRLAGAELRIRSALGVGTTVYVRVSLPAVTE